VIGWASRVAGLLAGLGVLAMTGLITFDVLMRSFFDQPQLFVDELASFIQVLVVFAGLAYTFRSGGHVRVDLVTSVLPRPVRAWLRVLTLALGVAFLAVVIWVTTLSGLTAYRFGRVSAVMLYPLWLPMLVIPAGLGLMAVAMLAALVRQIGASLGPPERRDEVLPPDRRG
jgi:TRAP-type C4-dicarboxylate transport system permease small subunit